VSAFLATGALSGCLVPPHHGFETPEDAVLTFQSAFARDDEFREYDCLARSASGARVTQQAWSTARGQIFAPLGAVGRFVLRRNSLADNLVGGTRDAERARLVYELADHALEVELLPEAAFVLPDPRTGGDAAFTLSAETAFVRRDEAGTATFAVLVGAPAELARRYEEGCAPWAELVNQWKIAGVAALPSSSAGPGEPRRLPPPLPPRTTTIRVDAIRPTRTGASLGTVTLCFELPLSSSAGEIELGPAGLALRGDRLRWEVAADSAR